MKIVVNGGTDLIGSKTVAILRRGWSRFVAASPKSGVNSITGEGVKEAMAGAQVVIDLANWPSFEDKAVLVFFQISGRNLLAAEAAASVRHHVALSIVGIDRADNGYFRAKLTQEKLIETSGIPYTIIRATQFMEFLAESPIRARMETSSGFRTACSSPSRQTTLLPSSPRWRSPRRETASSRSPARNAHRLTKCRPLSKGGRRSARGRARSRGPILGRPGRGALARAVGRGAPRPYWSRRMAPPLADKSLIPHPPAPTLPRLRGAEGRGVWF
jgi:uncharacterized protein YbjT (DUF2867 family)